MILSALQTNTDTFANSVDPDETAHHEPSHQDLHCLPFCSGFTTIQSTSVAMDVSKCTVGRAYFRNSGVKGLRKLVLLDYLTYPVVAPVVHDDRRTKAPGTVHTSRGVPELKTERSNE